MNEPQDGADAQRLAPEVRDAVKRAVGEIASPDSTSWESVAAAICVLLLAVLIPPSIAENTTVIVHYTERSIIHMTFSVLCIGFGFSALRKRNDSGRIIGALSALIGVVSVSFWLSILL